MAKENDGKVVLPESLVADLLQEVGEISSKLNERFAEVTTRRDQIRQAMLDADPPAIVKQDIPPTSDVTCLVVDGASIVEQDRASTYGVTCVARVGPDQSFSAFHSSIFLLPHLPSVGSLAQGFMWMQEIITAVESAEKYPDGITIIDGSKITAIIKINQFYGALSDEGPEVIGAWRNPAIPGKAGEILRLFESRDWVRQYIRLSNIMGSVKLVTTTRLVEKYAADLKGQFDDKVLAALVLEGGERTISLPLKHPRGDTAVDAPYHIGGDYPYSADFETVSRELVDPRSRSMLYHVYFRVPDLDVIYRLEFNDGLGPERYLAALRWFIDETPGSDLKEPYPIYVADRFVKEAVSVGTKALREVARNQSTSAWAWYFTGPNRSE